MLFDGFPDPEPVEAEPEEKLSAQRRLTLRQRADIDRGMHPLTHVPLLDPRGKHTCGDCSKRYLSGYRDHTYPKCSTIPEMASSGNDCRAWWPACARWTELC